MYAARDGQPMVVKALKDAGASLTPRDRKGRSAADLALAKGRSDVLQILGQN